MSNPISYPALLSLHQKRRSGECGKVIHPIHLNTNHAPPSENKPRPLFFILFHPKTHVSAVPKKKKQKKLD